METSIEILMDEIGCEDLFHQAGLNFILEAWISSKFAKVRSASCIRLVKSDRPDIAMRMNENDPENLYEVVEADIVGRKRALEYKNIPQVEEWSADQWATGRQAFEVIRNAACKKAKKAKKLKDKDTPYPVGTGLLIYLNIEDFGKHKEEIEKTFLNAVEPAKEWFCSIWILWGAKAYSVYCLESENNTNRTFY